MFLGGSKLRPELGRPDYSGFANAATIQAESMARIGASIAGAAKDYQDKKELKEANKLFDQMIKGFSDSDSVIGRSLQSVGLDDPKTISASRAGLGRKQMLEFINFLTEAEVKSTAQQRDPTTAADMTSIGNMLQRPEFKNIQFDESTGEAYMEVPNKDTLMPFDKKRVPPPAMMQNIPGFKDYGQAQRTTSEVADYAGMKIIK